ncbi:hypothetical protein [Kangiella marina]|uniref:Uncharacterized protein n=1 Tax=Kangiella marina TaxID=1079178 RepID=A0ABP8IDK6_9GAMM
MIIKRIMILSSLLVISSSLQAASTPEDCAAITNDSKRLACYDNFLKKQKQQREEAAAKPEKPAEKREPVLTAEQKFGAEKLKDPAKKPKSVNQIRSQAVGTYKRWKKGLPVTLENGQVWEITDYRSTYYKVKDPIITIEKGMFSSYLLEVEGLNQRFKAKRIK